MSDNPDTGAWQSAGSAAGLSTVAAVLGLCCAGPWAVGVLGVPAAVAMAQYQFLRPWLLGLAAVLLIGGFYRAYWARPQCADGSCGSRPSGWPRLVLWLALALTLLAAVAPEAQWLFLDPVGAGQRN